MTLSALAVGSVLAVSALQGATANALDRRLAGVDPGVALSRFVGYPQGAAKDVFRPNTNFWLKGIDFSCVSPWNSAAGRLRAGTAISKRHIVFARHFPLAVGSRIVFVDAEGAVCPCRVQATKSVGNTDIMVGSLDAELTPNIKPAKILPPDYEKHIGDIRGLPLVTFDQNEKAFLFELGGITTNLTYTFGGRRIKDKRRDAFADKIVVGDSGNPAFLLIGDEPVLAYCLYGGGHAGYGPAIHHYQKEVQRVMDELCPGYKLETFDFASIGRR